MERVSEGQNTGDHIKSLVSLHFHLTSPYQAFRVTFLRIDSNLYYNQSSNYFCRRPRRHWQLVKAEYSRKPNTSFSVCMKFEIFHCSQYPVLLSPVFVFIKLRLPIVFSNCDSRLTMGCARFISGSPLPFLSTTYTCFIVFKVLQVSRRTFCPPCIPPSLQSGQRRCTIGGQQT